jgi:F5/8 type C domain
MTMRPGPKLVVAAAAVLLLAAPALARSDNPPTPGVTLSVDPDHQQVFAGLPCLPAPPISLGMTNNRDRATYADSRLTAEGPLMLSRPMFSSYLPGDTTVTAPLEVSAAYGSEPGEYDVSYTSGREELTVPIEVVPPPDKGPGDNLLRGERAVPSSTYVTGDQYFNPCGGVDGDRTWSVSTAWNSANSGEFPQTYTVILPEPTAMNRVDLYTHASVGLTDWDVRVKPDDGRWQTVAEVRGNTEAHRTSTFPTVETRRFQIVCRDSVRHDYARIAEVEAYLQ